MPTWVRCRDKDTGHEYDLSAEDPRVLEGVVEVLEDYPENSGLTAQPRPAKHRFEWPAQPVDNKGDTPGEDAPAESPLETEPAAGNTASKKRSN
jgi:hypothetical protein